VLTHGWPGSIIEFSKVIDALANPVLMADVPRMRFMSSCRLCQDMGSSDNPPSLEWSHKKIASAWIVLMERLGYTRYVAQGGDWGAAVTTEMAFQRPAGLVAIHLNMAAALPEAGETLSAEEIESLASLKRQTETGRGYSEQQRTKPQTLGYALADSHPGRLPGFWTNSRIGLIAAMIRSIRFSEDDLLDNIMMYWLPNHAASAARLYALEWPKDWSDPSAFHVIHTRWLQFFPKRDSSTCPSLGGKEVWQLLAFQRGGARLDHFRGLRSAGHFCR